MLLVHFRIFFNGEPNSFLKDDAPPNKNIHHAAIGGKYRIRTYGPVTAYGFQDRRNKPLCQPSEIRAGFWHENQQTYHLFISLSFDSSSD